jgi:hypothetical protein
VFATISTSNSQFRIQNNLDYSNLGLAETRNNFLVKNSNPLKFTRKSEILVGQLNALPEQLNNATFSGFNVCNEFYKLNEGR